MVEKEGYNLKVINALSGKKLNGQNDAALSWLNELKRPLNESEQEYAQNKLQSLRKQQEKRSASRYDRYVVAAMERE